MAWPIPATRPIEGKTIEAKSFLHAGFNSRPCVFRAALWNSDCVFTIVKCFIHSLTHTVSLPNGVVHNLLSPSSAPLSRGLLGRGPCPGAATGGSTAPRRKPVPPRTSGPRSGEGMESGRAEHEKCFRRAFTKPQGVDACGFVEKVPSYIFPPARIKLFSLFCGGLRG